MAQAEVEERLSHGEPTWFIQGKKSFLMCANHHHNDRVAFWCACQREIRDALVAERPTQFFVPPYVGPRGWLGVYLDVPISWDEVAGIVEDAYQVVAPPKLRRRT